MSFELPIITYIVETSEKVFKLHFNTEKECKEWIDELIKAKRKINPEFKVYFLYSCQLISWGFD